MGNQPTTPDFSLTTLDLHGLSARDAVDVLEKKIQRALLAGVQGVKVLFEAGAVKVEKALTQYLETSRAVKRFHSDEARPGVTWVYFTDESPQGPDTGLRDFLAHLRQSS